MDILHGALAAHPLLDGFSEREIQRLSQCARRSMFHSGVRIFDAGDRADRFWLIQRGAVRLYVALPGGAEVAVETLAPPAVLGWSWMFHPYRWSFAAAAVETTHTVEFDAARVRHLADSEPEFGYELTQRFAGVIASRLRHTRRRLADLYRVAT